MRHFFVVLVLSNPQSSSHLAKCDGYSGWLCPENTVCRDDTAPNACKAASARDCEGICVPVATAGPPSPGRH